MTCFHSRNPYEEGDIVTIYDTSGSNLARIGRSATMMGLAFVVATDQMRSLGAELKLMAAEEKPVRVTHGPQKKGKGGKIRRW